MIRLSRTGETRERLLIALACLLAIPLILGGCSIGEPAAMEGCRQMCAPLPVSEWFSHHFDKNGRDTGALCVCADPPVTAGTSL